MFDELISTAVKPAAVIFGSLATAMLATSDMQSDERIFGVSISAIRELGSFGLIVVAVLGGLWIIKKGMEFAVPRFITFLEETTRKYLEEMKMVREEHALDLKEERRLREKSLTDFREMLQSHKADLGGKLGEVKQAIEAGNTICEKLVTELHSRPCQK